MSFFARSGRILTSIFMLLACLATGLVAQDNSGNIGGTILDPSGATVANAKITVTNTDRNQVVRIVSTDPTGSYSIPIIPVGIYSIKVEATGFKTEDRTGVIVNVSDDLRFNFKLQVGSNTETVEVKAEVSRGRTGHPGQRDHHRRDAGSGIGARHTQLRATRGADARRGFQRDRRAVCRQHGPGRRDQHDSLFDQRSAHLGQQLDGRRRRQCGSRQQPHACRPSPASMRFRSSRWSAASIPRIADAPAAARSTSSRRAGPAGSTAACTSSSATTN